MNFKGKNNFSKILEFVANQNPVFLISERRTCSFSCTDQYDPTIRLTRIENTQLLNHIWW
jgi:hypothetical protein